ncbi:beta/gamma crystallin-related protein [Sorangium sp. So ce1099]|uniref:beta/gamma crystallin-related protein n=1 Tax=Sorangium sp. So ce1099 TaxID=3133331 RepID=UPI003F63A91F
MKLSISIVCAALGSVAMAACVAEPGDVEGVQEASSEIIDGTVLSDDTFGVVTFGGCSSTIIMDRWLLTAEHCIDEEWQTNPGGLVARLNTGSETIKADRVVLHPTLDIALVHLESAFRHPVTGAIFSNPIYFGSNESLVGETLDCYGYGYNTADGQGFGTLRHAALTVSSLEADGYRIERNGAGQIKWQGDSGGPCSITKGGVKYVTGAASYCWAGGGEVFACVDTGAETFRDWAYAVMGAQAAVYSDADYEGQFHVLQPGSHDVDQLGIPNDELSSLRLPNGWTAQLWEDAGFQGAQVTYQSSQTNVGAFNDQTSSVVITGGVQIFEHSDYTGTRQVLSPGKYDVGALTIGNDALSSIRVPANWRVTLHKNSGFGGATLVVHGGEIALLDDAWNDEVSSITVEEPVVAYADENFSGRAALLWPGIYDLSELGLADDTLSSLRVPAGYGVTVWENGDFSGASFEVLESTASLGVNNDRGSSLEVFQR